MVPDRVEIAGCNEEGMAASMNSENLSVDSCIHGPVLKFKFLTLGTAPDHD